MNDYDGAISFYVDTLGFELVDDKPVPQQSKRWVVVAPTGANKSPAPSPGLELRAVIARRQPDRRPGVLFLHTDDFERDYTSYQSKGVVFVRGPTREPYGTVAVFRDLYGNLWDLIGLSTPAAAGGA